MIVEPVSTNARSRRRRVAARLLLAVPVALLVGVIGVGAFGTHPADEPGPTAQAIAASQAPRTGGRSVAPAPTKPTAATSLVGAPTAPLELDGLRVRSVNEVLAERAAGALDPPMTEIAVAGYLGVPDPPLACDMLNRGAGPLGVLGPLCTRDALLTAYQWTRSGGEEFGGIGPLLHAQFPQGVLLPDGIERTTDQNAGRPIATVLFGRFEAKPPAGCRVLDEACDEPFIVDGVAWADATAVAAPVIGLRIRRDVPMIR